MLPVAPIALLLLAAEPIATKSPLDEAKAALAEFKPEEAVELLERARDQGPWAYEAHARLYELLGIAYAYLERADAAAAAFDRLLAIDPGRAISYTLSPKVTFLFEQARGKAADRSAPAVQVSWSYDLVVGEEAPVQVEVISDPLQFLSRARLHHRVRGSPSYSVLEFALPPPGQRTSIPLPPVASSHAEALELYLEALDDRGNEVLRWGSKERPRDVALNYETPAPWYGRWWLWVAAGGVIAAGAAAAAVAVSQEPSPTVRGNFGVSP